MMEYLFSYGTLQREDVQLSLFGRILHSTADNLAGYNLENREISDEAFLTKGENRIQKTLVRGNDKNSVQGLVLELTMEELENADKYEPAGYVRKKIRTVSGKEVWIYLLA